MEEFRKLLIDDDWDGFWNLNTAQKRKEPFPPVEKPFPDKNKIINLIPLEDFTFQTHSTFETIQKRQSRRKFTSHPISLEHLSYLLWATQGLRQPFKKKRSVHFRNVPSAGGRHAFETYLFVNNVESLEPGIYRYLPLTHQLGCESLQKDMNIPDLESIERNPIKLFWKGLLSVPVAFFWSAIPKRMEWRYHKHSAKLIAIEAGHISQNLYIACESIDLGTFAIAAFYQLIVDKIFGLDGKNEFIFYCNYVGNVSKKE